MWFIQPKLTGTDPPAALTPEMIPPTMRPKPSPESNVVVSEGDHVPATETKHRTLKTNPSRAVRPRPSSPAKMVVTSRMLAAHTNGYPIDAKARFWSNYYRSLKDITREEPRPRVSETLPKTPTPASHSGPAVYPKSTYPLVLNTISANVRPSYYL